MKIFLDTVDVSAVTKHLSTGLVDGVTTTHRGIINAGRRPRDVYHELITLGVKHVSAELLGDTIFMVNEAKKLTDEFGEAITIKLPCTRSGLDALREIKKEPVVNMDTGYFRRVNITLVFSAAQAILASKSGADFVSVPVGLCDENSVAGLEVVRSVVELCRRSQTQVIADCIHDVYKVTRGFYNGADIVSMPPHIFEGMYDHVLTRQVLEDNGL